MKPITILLDKHNTEDWHDLRCVKCGRMFCKVNRDVSAVVMQSPDGSTIIESTDVAGTQIKCRGCECVYSVLIQ